MTRHEARLAVPGPGLLPPVAITALAATVLQVGFLERMKAHVVAARSLGRREVADAARAALGLDAVLALAALVVAAVLVVRAVRAAARGPGLASLVPGSRLGRLALLVLGTWTFVRWHASPGALVGFDLDLHAAHTALVAQEVQAGRVPAYTDAWYFGFPLLTHYGVAFYLPAGALAAWTDVRTAVKAVAALWHLLAAPAGYALARATGASRGTSLAAGVGYAASPFFVTTLAHLGSLTAAPVVALLPALLASSIRAGRGEGARHAVRAGAGAAALVLAHPAYAVLGAAAGALAFALSAATAAPRWRPVLVGALVAALVGALGALPVIAAFLLDGLPRAEAAPSALALVAPGPLNPEALGLLFTWSLRPAQATPTGYLGWTLAALFVVGLAVGSASRDAGRRRAGLLSLVLVATVLAWSGPGFVRERALLLLPAAMLPALATGLAALPRGRWLAIAAGLVLLDLTVGGLASPYRKDREPLAADLAALARAQGRERAILVPVDEAGRAGAGEWQVASEAPLRTVLGGFREGAPAGYAVLRAVVEAAAEDRTARDPALRRLLEQLGGVTVATLAHGRVATTQRVPGPDVLFAPRAARTTAPSSPPPDQLMAWAAAMAAPPGSEPGAIARVLLPGEGPPLSDHDDAAPLRGPVVLESVREGPRWRVRVQVPAAGWLRLAACHRPSCVVTRRGEGDRHAERLHGDDVAADVFGLLALRVPEAGTFEIVLDHADRRGLWPWSGAALLLALAGACVRRVRGARGPGASGA